MTYEEIVDKLNNGDKVLVSEVSGTQLFMLIHDHVIKNVMLRNTLYEFNFIPVDEPTLNCIFIDDELYPAGKSFNELFRTIIKNYEAEQTVGIAINDEYFVLNIEILETK